MAAPEPVAAPVTSAAPDAVPATLKARRDFLACARARRWAMPGMVVQGRDRGEPGGPVRVGYTCSKKVGNAVTRNRAKRRLRAAVREVLPRTARPGWDYVLIGRSGATVSRPFVDLCADLETAVSRIHRQKREGA